MAPQQKLARQFAEDTINALNDKKINGEPVLNCVGKVLSSSYETLTKGDLYILGVNPGQNPKSEKFSGDTIQAKLENLPDKKDNDYLDTSRHGREPGKDRLQRRMQYLAEELGFDLRKTCSSNLSFIRTVEDEVTQEEIDIFWPIHKRIIAEIVKPKRILTFGRKPYEQLKCWLGIESEESFDAGHSDWQCGWAKGEKRDMEIDLIGLPHLSIYTPEGKEGVMDKLKRRWREHA